MQVDLDVENVRKTFMFSYMTTARDSRFQLDLGIKCVRASGLMICSLKFWVFEGFGNVESSELVGSGPKSFRFEAQGAKA